MLKALSMLVMVIISLQVSAQISFTGVVTDENGDALTGANIVFENNYSGTVTGLEGEFSFENLKAGTYNIRISFIGYETIQDEVNINSNLEKNYRLDPAPVMGEEVIVSTVRAGEKDPVAYSIIDEDDIEKQNFGRDIPYILSMTPSLVSSSDAGNGVGYTGLRIRGTDANRINITVNGIPLNDAESHGVWWVNMPDFASSVDNVQIQRGVGTSTNGAAAFGASVNFKTTDLSRASYAEVYTGYGSFNTMKNNLSLGSGMINDHFTFDARLSQVHSDGFIDRATSDLNSYYLSAGYHSSKSVLKLTTFSGKEKTYQAWDGIPGDILKEDRTYNGIGKYTTEDGQVKYYDNETDNYNQTHYQLHFSHELFDALYLNTALHYTRGEGYYEQYKEDEDFGDYQLPELILSTDTITSTDLIRRKWLDNHFYGMIFSLKYQRNRWNASLGGGYNFYDGDHYGNVIWARYASDSEIRHQWYENTGLKKDYNAYAKANYALTNEWNIYGDLQVRGINYSIDGIDDDLRNITQEHDFLFLNPKAGVNFRPDEKQRYYLSLSIANREPNRYNFIDADPLKPLPVHETLYDYEVGYSYTASRLKAGINVYYMDYTDQLVLTGEINDVGNPVMTNVENSFRGGVELVAGYHIASNLTWDANLTLSKNRILDMIAYVDNWDYWSDPANELYQYEFNLGTTGIAFSPEIIAGSLIEYRPVNQLSLQLQSKYVGKQYIDNTSSEERKLDPYFINDLRINYNINTRWTKNLSINLLVANLFDHEYESNAWVYRYYYGGEEAALDGYFPQAGIHFMAGLRAKF